MSEEDGIHIDIRRFQSGDGERIRELNELAMATTPEYVPEAPDGTSKPSKATISTTAGSSSWEQ